MPRPVMITTLAISFLGMSACNGRLQGRGGDLRKRPPTSQEGAMDPAPAAEESPPETPPVTTDPEAPASPSIPIPAGELPATAQRTTLQTRNTLRVNLDTSAVDSPALEALTNPPANYVLLNAGKTADAAVSVAPAAGQINLALYPWIAAVFGGVTYGENRLDVTVMGAGGQPYAASTAFVLRDFAAFGFQSSFFLGSVPQRAQGLQAWFDVTTAPRVNATADWLTVGFGHVINQ